MSWKDKLKLEEGDKLELIDNFDAGHLGQDERYRYNIINSHGTKVGSVKYVESTSTKAPFSTGYSLQQYDKNGEEILSERW